MSMSSRWNASSTVLDRGYTRIASFISAAEAEAEGAREGKDIKYTGAVR